MRADLARLDGELRAATDTLHVLRSPAVQVVTLGGGAPQPGARGRIFWDRSRHEWLFFATELRPVAPGRTYELWLIDDRDRKIPAGTFDVDARGEGQLRVSLPADAGTIVAAAVTDEPAGGVDVPTGSIHLVGSIPSL
jgi:anti-sigma-K factor RskA